MNGFSKYIMILNIGSCFFTNYKVRSYLQSTIRVKLIIRNEKNRQKFYAVLDNQIKRDKK